MGIFKKDFFGGIYLEEFFGRNFFGGFFFGGCFLEDFFGRIFWEKFFGRNYLVEISKELMILSRFWGNFFSMEGRRKEDFRSIEVRRRLIALEKMYRKKSAIFNLSFTCHFYHKFVSK